jgi:hypothetical protein
MGFLDNLESNLDKMERADERETASERNRRQSEKAQEVAIAPNAEALKKSPYTMALLDHATRLGFSQRTKVNIAWLGSTLRLDAKDRRLELRPTAQGIQAVVLQGGEEVRTQSVDLDSDPEQLAREWLIS